MSLVIPCYNEQEVLPELRRRLKDLVSQYSFPIEVILVDDGSKDNTWPLIHQYSQEDGYIKAIRLARNFGHQTAITCGLDQTRGEVVVILDADLQDPPELIPEMLKEWSDGYDVVYGMRCNLSVSITVSCAAWCHGSAIIKKPCSMIDQSGLRA